MPIVDISILEGRTDAQKARLIEEVTAAVCRALDSPPERVRVLVRDVPHAAWGVAGKPMPKP